LISKNKEFGKDELCLPAEAQNLFWTRLCRRAECAILNGGLEMQWKYGK
jgi:hypothetical protein